MSDTAATPDDALRQLEGIRQSMAERFKFTQGVGELKAANGLPPADLDREARQIKRLRALAEESHLDPDLAEKFLNFIVAEVIHHHRRIADSGD
jgi:chorismate mutase